MGRRRRFLRNVTTAYPGTLGVPTNKGIQDVKPLPLETPTESYEIMLLRWQTGAYEIGASAPTFVPDPPYPQDAVVLGQQLVSVGMEESQASELARQTTQNVFSAEGMGWSGIPLPLADYLATSLPGSFYDTDKAVSLGEQRSVASFLTTAFAPDGFRLTQTNDVTEPYLLNRGGRFDVQKPPNSHSLRSAAEVGQNALAFDLRPKDIWSGDAGRADMAERVNLASTFKIPFDQSFYFAVNMSLRGSVDTAFTSFLTLWGLHQTLDPGDMDGSGPFGCRIRNGRFEFVTRHNDNPVSSTPPVVTVQYSEPMRFGFEYETECRIKLSRTGQGEFDAWINGQQVVSYVGRVGFNDEIGPFFKLGLYRNGGYPFNVQMWVRDYEIGLLPIGQNPSAEIALNGNFNTGANWTAISPTITFSSGAAVFNATPLGANVIQDSYRFEQGASYRLSYEIEGPVSGNFRIILYGDGFFRSFSTRSSSGQFVEILPLNSIGGSTRNRILLQPVSAPFTGKVKSVSVTKV